MQNTTIMTIHIKLFTRLLLAALVVMSGCSKEEYSLGDTTPPAKPTVNIVVDGKDATHPDGNGTGNVAVTITPEKAINYRVDFGDGQTPQTSTVNSFPYKYKHTGIKKFTVTVTVFGKAGSSNSYSQEISVYRAFEPDPAFVTMLTNNGTKKWRVDKDNPGHLGVSDANTNWPAWWAAGPNEKAGLGIYDDVYTFTAAGNVFTHETNNDMFGGKEYFKDFDPTLTGTGDYTLTGPKAGAYTETFSYDGDKATNTEYIVFSGKGHLGMYKGVHRYQVLERTATQMTLRCLQDPGAWYVKIIAIQ
jgi:hypothetical protein